VCALRVEPRNATTPNDARRAGAGFGFGATTDPVEREILTGSFRWFWELAERHPESTVKVRTCSLDLGCEALTKLQKITEHLYRDNTDKDDDLWYRSFVPDVRPPPRSPSCIAR
jgi:D-amino-acid oxidase